MFKAQLDDLTAFTKEMPEVAAQVLGLSNLNKAVESLFKNIMSEIDMSRQQMHELLEEIEIKEQYKKVQKRKKKPKKISASFSLFGKRKKQEAPLTDNEFVAESSDDADYMMSDHTEEAKCEFSDPRSNERSF